MAQLRAVSTRAGITAAGFVNHYEWSDLEADPSDWMRRYFDAFVYTANRSLECWTNGVYPAAGFVPVKWARAGLAAQLYIARK